MNQNYLEILSEYDSPNQSHTVVFDKHRSWLETAAENGVLKPNLLLTLKKLSSKTDIQRLQFVLFAIQGLGIDFHEDDRHFDFLFSISKDLLSDPAIAWSLDEVCWSMHLLMDISFHRPIECMSGTMKRKPDLIPEVLSRIGSLNYKLEKWGEGELAVYKSISLFQFIEKEQALQILSSHYLNHFDSSIRDDAKKMYEYVNKK